MKNPFRLLNLHDAFPAHADLNQNCTSSRRLALASLAIGSLLLSSPSVYAQELEPISDPNQFCLNNSNNLTLLTPPWSIDAELESDPIENRVDFYQFEAEAGSQLVANLQGASSDSGTLPDPFLGLFDDQCRLLAFNDDDFNLDSRLRFQVPSSGVFSIAATKFPDGNFDGSSGAGDVGTYRLSIDTAEQVQVIESISVRLVNQITREPVRGDTEPFASVDLYRCDENCNTFIAGFNADSDGRVVFDGSANGFDLQPGFFLLRARALDYGSNESGRFFVGPEEAFEVWDITLTPPSVSIGASSVCDALPPQGGVCIYDVNIDNNTTQLFDGLAWSFVEAFGLDRGTSTRFEATSADTPEEVSQRAEILIPALSSTNVQFRFDVPSFAPEGATFCQSLFIGVEPAPLYNPVDDRFLFCIEKQGNFYRTFQGSEMNKAGINGEQLSLDRRRLNNGLAPND